MNEAFLTLLKFYRSQKTIQWRRRNKSPRLPRTSYPIATEETYAAAIREIEETLVDFAMERIVYLLPTPSQTDGAIKKDAADEDYERFKQELQENLLILYGITFLESPHFQSMLANTSLKIFNYASNVFAKQAEALIGFPYIADVPNLTAIRRSWELTNYTLIRNLAEEYITRLHTLLLVGRQMNWSASAFQEQITKLNVYMLGHRVNTIARDQVGVLYSTYTGAMQQSIGINNYDWTTAKDERVRGNPQGKYPKAVPSHWEMESKICSWLDSTVYSSGGEWVPRTATMPMVAPGMEPGCRCTATPRAAALVAIVDKRIEGRE